MEISFQKKLKGGANRIRFLMAGCTQARRDPEFARMPFPFSLHSFWELLIPKGFSNPSIDYRTLF
jgi:hypothetical protein